MVRNLSSAYSPHVELFPIFNSLKTIAWDKDGRDVDPGLLDLSYYMYLRLEITLLELGLNQ